MLIESGFVQAVALCNGKHPTTTDAIHHHFVHPVISSFGIDAFILRSGDTKCIHSKILYKLLLFVKR
jgi:hypothetical protein